VCDHGGVVCTLDSKTPADLLEPWPWRVRDLLLEGADYGADPPVFRDAAHQRALRAAWSMARHKRPMELGQSWRRLDREVLMRVLEQHRGRDVRIADWLQRLGIVLGLRRRITEWSAGPARTPADELGGSAAN
jgi:hypothetical protein